MKRLRSALGVVLGGLVGAMAGVGLSIWLFGDGAESGAQGRLAALVVFAVIQVLAGFLAATVAGRRRVLHAGIVATLFALITLASMFHRFEFKPTWYRATVPCLGTAAIVFGGYLATLIRLRK